MSTSEQVDSTASSTWSARNLIPTRLVSYFRPGYRYHINNPDPEKSTSEQTDQKVKIGATWRFWEWRPMRWIFSYCQPRQDNNIIIMKYTGECPPSEDNHRTQAAFCYENENEVFGLKTNKNRSRLRHDEQQRNHSGRDQQVIALEREDGQAWTINGELHIDLNDSDHEDIAMKKDCDQLRKRHEELPRDISRRDELLSDLERKCEQLQTINKEQQKQLSKLEPENVVLTRNCSQLQTRMNELQRDLIKRDQENNALKIDCDQLRTRLSQTAAIQLTQGNPNIADLSDQNRPDKLAEQFSELYDNQWTDCYLVLTDGLGKTEEESISILLKVVKTSYDICRDRCQNISRSTKDILFDFAGCLHEKPDNALDALIQEILHKLKSHRTKSFKGVPKNIRNETKAKLASEIGEEVSADCDCFIDECIRICWLMCIKDPPMYICCHHEAVFDKSKYMEYTEMGQNITYVVWPALYLHKDGPLMRKGVAQGGDKIGGKETGKMKELTSQVCEPDHTQPSIASTNNATKMERQETESRSYSSDGNIAANIQTYTDINSDNNNINKHESPENERFNENASCSNIQNGDEVCTSSIETSDQYILDSVKSAANETHQSVKDAILYDASLSNDNNDTNSQLETNVEKAGLRFKEVKNRMTETHEEPLKCNNGHNKTEALNRSQAGSIGYEDKNDVESRSYLIKSYTSNDDSLKKENEKLICKYSTNGEPTERKERNDNDVISSQDYSKQRDVSVGISKHNGENQEKDKHNQFIQYKYNHDVKEGNNIVQADNAMRMGDHIHDSDKKENPQLINVFDSSNTRVNEETNKNCILSTKGETTEISEHSDYMLDSSKEHCELENAGAINVNEDKLGNVMDHPFTECNVNYEGNKPVTILLANSIGCRDNDNEKQETPDMKEDHQLSGNKWQEENEVCPQFTTKVEAKESKEVKSRKFSSDTYNLQMITLIPCNTSEEENQGNDKKDEVLKCFKIQDVKEKKLCDMHSDIYHEDALNSNIVCSSYNGSSDIKQEGDDQVLAEDEETKHREHPLQLPEEHFQNSVTLGKSEANDERHGVQKDDSLIVCSVMKKVNDAADAAHDSV